MQDLNNLPVLSIFGISKLGFLPKAHPCECHVDVFLGSHLPSRKDDSVQANTSDA